MKAINLKKKAVLIPNSWEDLNFKEKLFVFKVLIRVLHGDLKDTPHVGLLQLLIKFTGYKPSLRLFARFLARFKLAWGVFWVYILNIPFLFKYGWKEYREYARMLINVFRQDPESKEREREILDLGIIRLAEQIDFVYEIDTETRRIIPKYTFKANPFPWVVIGRKKYIGKRFFIDVSVSTDITARCFVDTLDLLMAMGKMTNREDKDECVNKMCSILYPAIPDHNENLLSGHARLMRGLNPVVKFGIVYWFTGIVQLFHEHPVYRILFDRDKISEDSGESLSVGMNEIVLFLKKEGYGDPSDMNLIDYFDAQIKSLKDCISKALADGVKPDKLAQKTGIPISTINKLS